MLATAKGWKAVWLRLCVQTAVFLISHSAYDRYGSYCAYIVLNVPVVSLESKMDACIVSVSIVSPYLPVTADYVIGCTFKNKNNIHTGRRCTMTSAKHLKDTKSG